MSIAFRELLKKVGSGTHTSESLSRAEAANATRMMLTQDASPAQIGAFLIAHRIKRPTGTELAGMLDAYEELGPRLSSQSPITVFGIPYDGRTRTATLAPVTALILATAGYPVLMHGGRRMPTKEGAPLVSFWQGLGVDWCHLSLTGLESVIAEVGVGCLYLPTHFPLAETLVQYREDIGKRPPFATLELIWSPYASSDPAHVVAGFVHPPTETMFREALSLRGNQRWTTVKGLEGSCDLPRERTAIIGLFRLANTGETVFERLHLHPREYGFTASNVALDPIALNAKMMQATLAGEDSDYTQSIVWNSGFYLWNAGATTDLDTGIAFANELLVSGKVMETLKQLQSAIARHT
jgi:anthranilate phosphoribosyltransferase